MKGENRLLYSGSLASMHVPEEREGGRQRQTERPDRQTQNENIILKTKVESA